ncbi:Na/Pi cotransporter family protein [Geovibrio thiophilus]|uniref:Na/Pi cotransporter family protein n=1 Tax=Geovibrio thiophilus TaxID=139438 RepID=A0A410JWA9_9BACT|nr:Na/Pi cotransporter family protein [Geovibrio thiophilus]QAR32487.1 Na/Pi cotransporter family protein [Geovibrio thiophilus]
MTSSDWFNLIAGLFGGLGLFIFGMKLMSEALQKSAGQGLKKALEKLTSNRFVGTFVGLAVTAVIQSSSATTVMVVGFVNAGLMNLTQALSVVLGANLGTTVTAQLIAFDIEAFALPAIAIGMMMKMFSKDVTKQYWGEILLGFGMLFIGMEIMKDGFVPLRKTDGFRDMFVFFSSNPILAVTAGALLTVIVQSSSATIGITIALATTGLIDFYGACALVLGENIGTTITANLAAIGTNRTAKQAAFGHFLLNFIGVVYMLFLLRYLVDFVNIMTPHDADFVASDGSKPYIARHIANLHTMFNLINMLVFLPFIHYLARLCEVIIKPDKPDENRMVRLSDNIMSTPAIAVEQAKKELMRMSGYAESMVVATRKYLVDGDESGLADVKTLEGYLDTFDKEISAFLVKLSMKNISQNSANQINRMHHVVHNLEKIGDYSESIYNSIKKIKKKQIVFTPEANEELKNIYDVVERFYTHTMNSYMNGTSKIDTEDEDIIDSLRKRFKKNHVKRLNAGECTIDAGLIYVDILNCLEKIGDHTFNIAQVLMAGENAPVANPH